MQGPVSSTLRIVHCLSAPAGGLFRHVHDLALGQVQLGAEVGIVCDSRGDSDPVALARLSDNSALGLTRIAMPRHVGLRDWVITRQIARLGTKLGIDVLHGHGVKGGAYARLAARKLKRKGMAVKSVYTPHDDILHYSPSKPLGRFYFGTERKMLPMTDGLLFESYFAANRYTELVGPPLCPARIVPNGLHRYEFYEPMVAENAVDFVFIGELNSLSGVDVLLEALAVHQAVFPGRALIVGSGPDEARLKRLARKLGLHGRVSFPGAQSARSAFARARCVVVPSRLESLPYIVLEAAAAQMPLIATRVGGIPEIVDGVDMPLIAPDDVNALASQLRAFLVAPKPFLDRAALLQRIVAERFTVENMTHEIVDFYISEVGAGVS
jgi:glycosyltransferase involved in cell wall biosynthesis